MLVWACYCVSVGLELVFSVYPTVQWSVYKDQPQLKRESKVCRRFTPHSLVSTNWDVPTGTGTYRINFILNFEAKFSKKG